MANIKLLVVDDNRQYFDLLKEHAEMCSHEFIMECALVSTQKEAFAKIENWQPSIVLIDAHVRGCDCYELLETCRDGWAPVVVTSEFPSPEIEHSALSSGAIGYFSKTTDSEELDRIITRLAEVSADWGEIH